MARGRPHCGSHPWRRGSIALGDRHKIAFTNSPSVGACGSSGTGLICQAMHHDVLLTEFEARIGPGLDVVSQRLRALLPIIAVHATVGLRGSFRVAHGIEPQAMEAVANEQFAK